MHFRSLFVGTSLLLVSGYLTFAQDHRVSNVPEDGPIIFYSKGGLIAIHVSSFLGRSDIRYVFLAACGNWTSNYPHLRLTGKILSVVEESDELAGSCSDAAANL